MLVSAAAVGWPLLALAACSAGALIPTDDVPLLGPSFISNVDHSKSKYIEDAKLEFPKRIESLFAEKLNRTDLIFTVDVFSATTNSSIYSYSHVGEGQENALTAGELNDKTISRLGSVSKIITTYGLLNKAGIEIFRDPVTKYLPELRRNSSSNPLEKIEWDAITVGELASHQAGTGGAYEVLTKYIEDLSKLTPKALLAFMRDEQRPVVSVSRNAVYSDAGYLVLGQVLARITGKTYQEAIQEVLFDPLGLNSTSVTVPTGPELNVIDRKRLANDSFWDTVIPVSAPSGGAYSNLADMRAVGLSILNSQLLSPQTTRAWMKPLSGTGSLVELVGAPWEITRLTIPVMPGSNRTRVSDLYLKGGGTQDYTAFLALSPDHGIGYSVLIAGQTASAARWPIRQAVGEIFVPAAEFAVAENAQANIAGTFVDPTSNGSTKLTLSFDEGKPGLGAESLTIDGVDSLGLFAGLGAKALPDIISLRAYPTGLNSASRSLASLYQIKGSMKVSHRAIVTTPQYTARSTIEGGEGGLFDNSLAWMNLDMKGPLDELDIELIDGKAVFVTLPGVEKALKRKMVLKRVD